MAPSGTPLTSSNAIPPHDRLPSLNVGGETRRGITSGRSRCAPTKRTIAEARARKRNVAACRTTTTPCCCAGQPPLPTIKVNGPHVPAACTIINNSLPGGRRGSKAVFKHRWNLRTALPSRMDPLLDDSKSRDQQLAQLSRFCEALWLKRQMTDVEVQVEAEVFQAHKLILTCHSPYFHKLLINTKPEMLKAGSTDSTCYVPMESDNSQPH
ncbi:uncharacterized protein LOC142559388 [Dermacentor variabilis]|uniref:uncharacterized protein LOC142559388 n=1 Tax=Dermacentor variabilis TaxID=34621 RepID=UPI003F5B41B6